MALIGNSFLKVVQTNVSVGEASAGSLTRTYTTTRVEDLGSVSVFYNGQGIPKGAASGSKYYYEVSATLAPADMSSYMSGTTVPGDTSSITFTLYHNPAYRGPGYADGASTTTFLPSDAFILRYYYTIYSVA